MTCPDQYGPQRLSRVFCEFLSSYSCVQQTLLFGSLARGDWDRWSDVDVLTVVDELPHDCYGLFIELAREFPFVHHGSFEGAESGTMCVLGNVLKRESPFHVLDLNFVSASALDSSVIQERFGPTVKRGTESGERVTGLRVDPTEPQTEDEQCVWAAMHWVHKGVKKYHRGQVPLEEVEAKAADLRKTLVAYPEGISTANGSITMVAYDILEYAADLLDGNTGPE